MKMKPLPLALAISSVLGLSMATYADDSDGEQNRGPDPNVKLTKRSMSIRTIISPATFRHWG